MMRIDYKQLEFIDKTLREMIADAEEIYRSEVGEEPVITSLYRIGDKGVHGTLPLRGVDLRCRDEQKGRVVARRVNALWQYNHQARWKVCAIAHGKGANFHIHLQVHPNTERK